jgi:hypothetical protein
MSNDSWCLNNYKLNILERVVYSYDEATGAHSKRWVKFRSTKDFHFMQDCFYDFSSNKMVRVDEYTGEYMKEIRANQPPPSPSEKDDYDSRRFPQSSRTATTRVSLDYRTDLGTVRALQEEATNQEPVLDANYEDSLDLGPASDDEAEEIDSVVVGEGRSEAGFSTNYAECPEDLHRCSKRRKLMGGPAAKRYSYFCTCPVCNAKGFEKAMYISFDVDEAFVYKDTEQDEYDCKQQVMLTEDSFLSPDHRLPNVYRKQRDRLRRHLKKTAIQFPDYLVPAIAFLHSESDELIGKMTVGKLRSNQLTRDGANSIALESVNHATGPQARHSLPGMRGGSDPSDLSPTASPSYTNGLGFRSFAQPEDGATRTIRPQCAPGPQARLPLPGNRGGSDLSDGLALSRTTSPSYTNARPSAQPEGSAIRILRPQRAPGPQTHRPLHGTRVDSDLSDVPALSRTA